MRSVVIGLVLSMSACTAHTKGPEQDELGADGKSDALRSPTEHGALDLVSGAEAELTSAELFHAWEFELSDDATITLKTAAIASAADDTEIDTVMYLYRQTTGSDGQSRWGSYIARNDDSDGLLWSKIERSLGAGVYRVIVKGYSSHDLGEFAVAPRCEGDGCPSDEPGSCRDDSECAQPLCQPGGPCFTNVCVDGTCVRENEAGMCRSNSDCAQPSCLPGGPCFTNVCVDGACVRNDTAPRGPQCGNQGTRSEGWVQSDGTLICYANCASATASCGAVGTRSEGWYASTPNAGCRGGALIGWDNCSN